MLATPNLLHYYRLDEANGPTIDDAKGTANGTLNEAIYGVPGAINGDPNTAIGFPGAGDPTEGELGSFGSVPMDLSGQSSITVEFWLKWSTYGNDDALAMEFTPNYNSNAGGFMVDPDAPQFGGTFGVGLGNNTSRNSIFFARPERRRVAPLCARVRQHGTRGQRGHPVRGRAESELPAGRRRHWRGSVRQLDSIPDVARRDLAVRQRLAR